MALQIQIGRLTRSILPLAVLATLAGGLALVEANAATTKVPTRKFTVPIEENDAPSTGDADTAIPDDALPNLDQSPGASENDDTPSVRPEGVALPPVLRDPNLLPSAVRETQQKLKDIAVTGEIEKLREIIGIGETATTLSIGGLEGDPIEFLKETSGDPDGYELLAILLEVLEAGYVHVDAGTDSEMYIWPYFFAWPFDKLTPPMKVELYRILTAGDVQDSTDFGGYIFYRVGIKPDGTWDFFVAGD